MPAADDGRARGPPNSPHHCRAPRQRSSVQRTPARAPEPPAPAPPLAPTVRSTQLRSFIGMGQGEGPGRWCSQAWPDARRCARNLTPQCCRKVLGVKSLMAQLARSHFQVWARKKDHDSTPQSAPAPSGPSAQPQRWQAHIPSVQVSCRLQHMTRSRYDISARHARNGGGVGQMLHQGVSMALVVRQGSPARVPGGRHPRGPRVHGSSAYHSTAPRAAVTSWHLSKGGSPPNAAAHSGAAAEDGWHLWSARVRAVELHWHMFHIALLRNVTLMHCYTAAPPPILNTTP
jgi:hypothetical protein